MNNNGLYYFKRVILYMPQLKKRRYHGSSLYSLVSFNIFSISPNNRGSPAVGYHQWQPGKGFLAECSAQVCSSDVASVNQLQVPKPFSYPIL